MSLVTQQIALVGAGFAAAMVAFYAFHIAKRMREVLAVKFKRLALGLLLAVVVANLSRNEGWPEGQAGAALLAAILLPLWIIRAPKKSRYIPARLKRTVIARSGIEDYDSRRYHIDHTVPLAKNGDTSVENLRVIPKEANLRKGAKMPRLKDFL